jgi:hypothetical protein
VTAGGAVRVVRGAAVVAARCRNPRGTDGAGRGGTRGSKPRGSPVLADEVPEYRYL